MSQTDASAAEHQLPDWDLSHLYPGPDSAEFAADLEQADSDAKALESAHKGRVAELDGAALGTAILAYEAISERLGRLASYAYLRYAGDMADQDLGRFNQTTRERITDISSRILFFTLELNRLEDADLELLYADPEVARYRPWIEATRLFRPHELGDDMERLLLEKSVAGRQAWVRLFDETMADIRLDVGGAELTLSDTLDRLSEPNRETRRQAAEALTAGLESQSRVLTLITNTLAKDKAVEDLWRSHANPMASRNLANQVEDEVVDALVGAVRDGYPRLSHRYYQLKAGWLGFDVMQHWDRNAPLPEDDDSEIGWRQARETVLGAYHAFEPEMAAIAGRFFDENWIDAPPRPGKQSGAFSHPTVPSAHPYVLLNFHGRSRDVMTLAHELGHGVHQVLAAGQGALLADTPLTLAETASVFGEMLTFRAMLDAAGDDPRRRRVLLAGKVEDMLNTVVRQIAFHSYEARVHAARAEGELSTEAICDIWMDAQRESLGPAFEFRDDYRMYWAYVPHFLHVPFYVYAYAFGDCLVNSLYAVFQSGHAGFQDKYLEMLRAGGTLRHRELLAPFGLDAADPAFWSRGLDVIAGLIDELEALG